ncbi:DUF6931 family protein (plasmid) [Roseobacteraceae bacterium NS-SX3]
MTERFQDLAKFPNVPVAGLLARADVLLRTRLESPPQALAPEVLAELERKGAEVDMLRVLSVLLPPRERVWWACLAARDCIGLDVPEDPPALAAAEAWALDPSEANRTAARISLDNAYTDDDTVNCALAVLYADGTMGPGELSHYPAPAGASEHAAFTMNKVALELLSAKVDEYGRVLAARALDLARGADGRFASGGLHRTGV